ncbi:MAG TPA: HEPN domain-containing protein [Conexibacter sp.]|nr:HEPN domain-containing protein [Conexibacter sp.]
MSPKPKHELAREHLERASTAIAAGDVVVAITFLHLAAEAAVVTLAEREGIPTQKSHAKKATAAHELHERNVVADDLRPILMMLNQARKDAGYEGEDPELDERQLVDIADRIDAVVSRAEELAR